MLKLKGEIKMKTKKLQQGSYEITTSKNIYRIEQNIDLFDKGWEIIVDNEIIDIASTLSEGKSVIKMIEERV